MVPYILYNKYLPYNPHRKQCCSVCWNTETLRNLLFNRK